MTTITLPRATVEQALEAMRCAVPTGKITLADWHKSIAELEAVLAQQVKHVAWMRPWPPVRAQIEMDAGADFEIGPDLAQQAEPVEPMAWAYMGIKQDGTEHGPHLVWKPEYMDAMSASKGAKAIPLYTAPPQRKPLTDEKISDLWCEVSNTDFVTADTHVFARAVERAHGIGDNT